MDSSSNQSRPSSRQIWKYEVFLSFRGGDIRNNFADHLHARLIRKGIFVFKDDKVLKRGDDISPGLLQAIKDSRISIVVFSKDYADSTWCLEEMAIIAECREELGQTVLPVYYDVDPFDVRHQKGTYKHAFNLHTERFEESPGKVDRWRRAMKDLTDLSGWDARHTRVSPMIEQIVHHVSTLLGHPRISGDIDDLVGIQSGVEVPEKLLKLSPEDDNVRILGIWGIGGIGKTTYAKVLCNRISNQFDTCCFIEDVSKIYRNDGSIAVLKEIIHQMVGEENLESYGPSQIDGFVVKWLHNKKLLIVLDNVDHLEQLHNLALNPYLCFPGSRIIITTRDKHVLQAYGANKVYEVPPLRNEEAHELLCRTAFRSHHPPNGYQTLISQVLEYAAGLPLAIRTLASWLYERDVISWAGALDRLWYDLPGEIMDVFHKSFEKLEEMEKEIFLHISCFFNGKRVDYVKRILDCHGLHPDIGIQVLIDKSLVTIINEEIKMHNLLQLFGKKIVQEKFPENPNLWSRLWLYEDFQYVMTTNEGTNKVEAIVLDKEEDVHKSEWLMAEGFSKMWDLRLLILHHKEFSGSLNFLSNNLHFLSWHNYPFTYLPSNFQPSELVELNMPGSCIIRPWEGIKLLPNLRRIDLSFSKDLETTSDFTGIPNLEWLDLTGCTNLSLAHPSIGRLQKLGFLSLRNCSNLVSFLDGDGEFNSSSLEVLDLAGCTKLVKTPDFRGLPNLELLDLEQCTSLMEVDASIGVLTRLKRLRLRDCTNLVCIPDSINSIINSLEIFDFQGCPKLESSPLRQRTTSAVDSSEPSRQSQSFNYLDQGSVRESSRYFGPYNFAMTQEEKKQQEGPRRNSPNWSEFREIENIVQEVIKRLGHKFSGFAEDLVGIQSRVKVLENLLKLGSKDDDFRVLGISGMPGIGKTTHATVLYDKISYHFEACCFIEDVSKTYRDGGATAVHKQILHQTLDEKNLESFGPSQIAGIIQKRLSRIKVLIVLDNVDESVQLENLALNPKLLRVGSRIIITTQDEHVLNVYGRVAVHKVSPLEDSEARELFCTKAFKIDDPSKSCEKLIPEVLKYAQKHPLSLRVLGSFLCTLDATQWRDTLNMLETSPHSEIMDVLQVSYDRGLKPKEKEIFLDIDCFFNGENVNYVKRIMDCCELHPHIGITMLKRKSLITITGDNKIQMQEMLQILGKKLVREGSPGKPEQWSRLWLYKDLQFVMKTKKQKIDAQAVVLDKKDDVNINKYGPLQAEEFSKMQDLRLLILHHKKFSGSLNFLSNSLHFLSWHNCPCTSLPSDFEPGRLVELNMPHSCIIRLWEDGKHLPNLRRVDLSFSKDLETTPDFTRIPNLERLDLRGCTNLSLLHPSIGSLQKLAFLSLRNCSRLISFLDEGSESNLSSLKVVEFVGCTKLTKTPDFKGLPNLELLDLEQCTSLKEVDESIGVLTKLKCLRLRYCTNLVSVPNSINKIMNSLEILDFHGCSKLERSPLRQGTTSAVDSFELFHQLQSLISLDLGFCNLSEVAAAIGELNCLERLNLEGNSFDTVPSTIKELSRLAYLNLSHCKELQSLPKLPSTSDSSVGRYFSSVVGARSHTHRSGLYIFNCPKLGSSSDLDNISRQSEEKIEGHNDCLELAYLWLIRLLKEPNHFRGGFDIVIPASEIPKWFDHQLMEGSIRIEQCSDVDDDNNWIGVAFCVAFVVNPPEPENSVSSVGAFNRREGSTFYLAFEIEHVEWGIDMPLRVNQVNVDGSEHLWLIYISWERCQFLATGTRVTFKACPGVEVKKWGLRWVVKQDMEPQNDPLQSLKTGDQSNQAHHPPFSYARESSSDSRPSQPTATGNVILNILNSLKLNLNLPHNLVTTEEEEKRQEEARRKVRVQPISWPTPKL